MADKCTFYYSILSGPGRQTLDEIAFNLSTRRGRVLSNTVSVTLESPDGNQFVANLKLCAVKQDKVALYMLRGEFARDGESLWTRFSEGAYNVLTQRGYISG